MDYDASLKRRRGTKHVAPDALSGRRRRSTEEPDASTPGDLIEGEEELLKGPSGPVSCEEVEAKCREGAFLGRDSSSS